MLTSGILPYFLDYKNNLLKEMVKMTSVPKVIDLDKGRVLKAHTITHKQKHAHNHAHARTRAHARTHTHTSI